MHSATGVSPFEIIHGRKTMLPIDIQFHCEINVTSDDYNEGKHTFHSLCTKAVYFRSICFITSRFKALNSR